MFYIVLLLLLGVLFLVGELLLIPGSVFGVVLALICNGSAIATVAGVAVVVVALLLALISTIFSLRAKTWRKISLHQELDAASMPHPETKLKVGDRGVAVSRLAPAGKVEICGETFEARSVDVYVEQRSEVEVVGFENFTVVIKKVN